MFVILIYYFVRSIFIIINYSTLRDEQRWLLYIVNIILRIFLCSSHERVARRCFFARYYLSYRLFL